jgi:hypothetical protein
VFIVQATGFFDRVISYTHKMFIKSAAAGREERKSKEKNIKFLCPLYCRGALPTII